DRGRHVMPREGAFAGMSEQHTRAIRERSSVFIQSGQLLPVVDRLLVVVADDLVEVAGPARIGPGGPVRKALVQLCATLLWNAGIGGVTNQGVPEPVGVFTARSRSQQVLASEAEEARVHLGAFRLVLELQDGAADELLSGHGRAFEHRTLLG